MRSLLKICIIVVMTTSRAQAESFINFSGTAQNGNLGDIPWVVGTTMWETIETGEGMGTFTQDISTLEGLDPMLLTWTFGDLELTDFRSPTPPGSEPPATFGFEFYSEADESVQPLEFFYDDVLWARGEVNELVVNVNHSSDIDATGTGLAKLNTPGVETDFFSEIMELSGGSGLLEFTIDEFDPVDSQGLFSSSGTITVIPEPGTYGLFFLVCSVLYLLNHIRMKQHRKCASVNDLKNILPEE